MIIAASNTLFQGSDFINGIDPNSAILPPIEVIVYKKKQKLICDILLVISDAQTMTGMLPL